LIKHTAFWFYFGTLISSIGSFSFNICLVAFMAKAGFDLLHISLILGLQRLVPIIVATLYGHRTDELSPRLTVVAAEMGAALASIGILWAWARGHEGYWFLVAFSLVKTSIVSFQVGSKAKITKILADDSYASSASHAIWFNKATQGATLFAGLCAWPIVKFLGFETAIWFDLLTFAINGLIVFFLPIEESVSTARASAASIFSKFSEFYRFNRRAAALDLVLAISMMGTTSFTARLTGTDQTWMAVLIGSYGASVWLSGFIERSQILKDSSLWFWAGLGVSYALLGMFPGMGIPTVALALCKDTFYWLLFHRISSHIQMDTPESHMGAITSARMTQMVAVLACGELLVGAWSKSVPILFDGGWRAAFCLMIFGLLTVPQFQAEKKHGYAKL
jgi:hypothetical protein